MTWDRWKLVASVAKARWGKLRDSNFDAIASRGQPADRIQERDAVVRGDTDGLQGKGIACASLFADTEADWRSH
jgi:hypothetical protein